MSTESSQRGYRPQSGPTLPQAPIGGTGEAPTSAVEGRKAWVTQHDWTVQVEKVGCGLRVSDGHDWWEYVPAASLTISVGEAQYAARKAALEEAARTVESLKTALGTGYNRALIDAAAAIRAKAETT